MLSLSKQDRGAAMRHPIALVACLGAVFTLAPLAIDMYLAAFPAMADSLATTIDHVEASVSVFLLGYAISQLLFGPLSDRYGRAIILTVGLVLFVAGSVLSGLATSVEQLYAFRLVQALGGGASVVVFAIVKDRFDEKASAQVISYIMALVVVAPLVAPIIGGYILVAWGWPAIFFILAAYGAATLVLVKLVVVERVREPRPRGALTASIGRLFTAYATVLTNGRAMAHILAGGFSFAGLFAFVAGSPFVYIAYFGVAPQHYGFLVGANAAMMIAMNLVNARLLHDAAPSAKTVVAALLIGAAGVALVVFNAAGLGLAWIVGGVVAFVGLLGLISANAVAAALADFPDDSGTASAVYGVCMFGLGAVSSVIVSSIESTDATAMVTVMAGCGVLASLSVLPLIVRRRQAAI